jgi:tyrosine aminotransferase
MEAVVQAALYKPHAAGYTHASGSPEARRAIAMHHSCPQVTLSPDHVIVTNGCSGALELALTSLLDPGTTLLIPKPGFPLYQEIAEAHGANVVHYRLDPNRRWECDMSHLEEIMASHANVRGIVINNPSSPTGSVFSEKHLQQILDFALKHHLLVVADEVYGSLTFGSNKFHPMAQVAARNGQRVPVVTTSGLSKQFMIPGWRLGWVTFQDNLQESLKNVEAGAHRLAQIYHGVSSLTQSAIPAVLSPSTPGLDKWREKFRSTLEQQAMLLCSGLNDSYGLKVAPPQGSLYAIVKINIDRLDIEDDMEFAMKLVEEENVFVLPGTSFGVPNTFRVAYTSQESTLEAASQRINDFCRRHTRKSEDIGE